MTQVTFQMVVFNGDYVLEQVLEPLLLFGDVIVTEGPVAYYTQRGYKSSTDRTNEILHQFIKPRHILHGQWQEKDAMMCAGADRIPRGTTHVWMVDADEVWEPAAIRRVLELLDNFDSVSFKPHTFYGGFERVLSGFEMEQTWYRIQRWYPGAQWRTHRPPTVLHSDGKPMREHRHWNSSECFYHYSYVFPQQVCSKIAYYESWGSGVIPDYFHRVYLPWVEGNEEQKRMIESEYNGVHEWLPKRRSACFTRAFTNIHPDTIKQQLPQLRQRFLSELREV